MPHGPIHASVGHLLQPEQDVPLDAAPRVAFVCPDSSAVSLVRKVVSPGECNALIQAAEDMRFTAPAQFKAQDRVCERIHTVDRSLSVAMMARLRSYLPEELVVDGVRWRITRFTHHWRYVRYFSGGHFAPHYDGAKLLPWREMSMFTVQVYLNSQGDDFTDGETRFFSDFVPERFPSHEIVDGTSMERFPSAGTLEPTGVVRPSAGDVLVFDHAGRSVLHDAQPVGSGRKYILRGDVMYAAVPEDIGRLDQDCLQPGPRTWCAATAAEFGTRDFTGQVWTCDCAKDRHGSDACCSGWQSYHEDATAASSPRRVGRAGRAMTTVLISGKRASGKDYVGSLLQCALEARGLCVASKSSASKDAACLDTDREHKEEHSSAIDKHHWARDVEDPEQCLREVWQQAAAAQADVLLVTDFRTRADYRFFAQQCEAHSLFLLRVEASEGARQQRGWAPGAERDTFYSETDLDSFVGWTACFDNSSDEAAGLAEEWISHTVLPRLLAA